MVSSKVRTREEFHLAIQRTVLLLVITFSLLFAAKPVFAAGGSCPTGNTIDAEGHPVSLSTLGITTCFYISKSSGADTNSGTSESAPWAHLPGMPSCTGTCSSTTPTSGEGFILRGGDTWVSSDLQDQWIWSGSSSNPLYIGIDSAWFNSGTCGSSWCRPIFSEGGGNSDIFGLSNSSNIIIDNVEVKGFTDQGTVFNAQGSGTNIRITRVYIHGWAWASGGNNTGVFRDGNAGTIADHFIIDGSDSTKNTINGFFGSWSQIQYGYISYAVSGVLGAVDIVHDVEVSNTVTSVDGDHCNGIFGMSPNSANGEIFYNNLIHNGTACPGGVVMWFNGNGSTSASLVNYGFNNVMYNLTSNPLDIGNHPSGPYGTYYWFNNTVDCTVGGCGGPPPSGPYFTVYDNNNQVIGNALDFNSGGSDSTPVCNQGAGPGCTDLTQNESVANAQGYSSSELFPYTPISGCTSSTCSTVQKGTNLQSYCSALSSMNAAAGTACLSSTSAGCSYSTTNHTLSCPNDAENPRGSTWDIGAYQYSNSAVPAAPTGLTVTVQ